MNYNKTAIDVYRKFSSFEGNQHIASEFALKCVLKLVVDFKIKRILEIGLGIGCIVDSVLEFSKEYGEIDYYGTENIIWVFEPYKATKGKLKIEYGL